MLTQPDLGGCGGFGGSLPYPTRKLSEQYLYIHMLCVFDSLYRGAGTKAPNPPYPPGKPRHAGSHGGAGAFPTYKVVTAPSHSGRSRP